MKSKTITTAVLITVMSISLFAQTVVEQWHPVDISFESTEPYPNPFQNLDVSATFVGPGGTTLTIPGFFNGGNTWIVRFSPTKIGKWIYTSSSNDAQLNHKTGTVTCIVNTQAHVHGRLGVDESYRHHFKYEDGTRFFLMGCEIDWLALIDMQDADLTKTKQIIDMYTAQGFNTVLMNAYAYDTRWRGGKTEDEDWGPPLLHPWPGPHDNHDFSRLDSAYWNHYDKVIEYLFKKGMVAYIYFKVYNKLVHWPAKGSKNDELYFSHIVARYQAYPNIIWCFAKESYYEPDHAYIHKMLDLITEKDTYQRLRTTHDDNGRGDDYAFDGTLGDNLDFYTDQTQRDVYNNSLTDYLQKEWPVSNMEPGYQGGNDGTSSYQGDNLTAEELVKRMYEVVMAGAYGAYYYTWHAWDVVRTGEEPKNLNYYKYLTDFFTRTKWYELVPDDNLITGNENHCLAKAGSEYIVYLGNGGSTTLTIDDAGEPLQGTWMNVFTGAEENVTGISNGSKRYTSPWGVAPALLWIHEK